ncbi:hypothetical protein P835_03431 [Citrobacter portucalensis]|nr:hypothetical protein P835_03431 [Citrobacter portucalensis]
MGTPWLVMLHIKELVMMSLIIDILNLIVAVLQLTQQYYS